MSPNSSTTDTASAPSTESQWRPHVVAADADDWVRDLADDLAVTANYTVPGTTKTHKPRILVLYGSLRDGSFSRALAYECARILDVLGADVRVFTPHGLPPRDPSVEKTDPKVQELRALVQWSEGHVWVSPEMHGQITGVFKNQIDWIPPSGEVHPTQGKTTVVLQVNGGANSFNAVNTMRVLSRWMRMSCSTAQLSVASAWKEFDGGRMKPSGLRSRVVDVIEEFYRFTLAMREQSEAMADRYSERKARAEAEANAEADATAANP